MPRAPIAAGRAPGAAPSRTRRLLAVLFLLAAAGTTFSAAGWAGTDGGGSLAPAQVASYEVRWIEKRAERVFDGDLAEGAERSYALDLRQDNLTRVDAVLSWVETGDAVGASGEDSFRLDVRNPQGAAVAGSPARGDGNVLVLRSGTLNRVPDDASVDAAGLPAAVAQSDDAGRGTWRVVVALENAGNPAGQRVDMGNAYVLTIVFRWYEVNVLRSVTLEPRTLPGPGWSQDVWEYATIGLGGASVLLGGLLLAPRKRKGG